MQNFFPFILNFAITGPEPSVSNLVSYILIFLVIAAIFLVVRIAIRPPKETGAVATQPQLPAPPALPATPPQPSVSIPAELIAAAVAAAHAYLRRRPTSSQPSRSSSIQAGSVQSAWVLSERMNPYFREDPYFREKIRM